MEGDDEEQWEYEYDQDATEVFLVDLDLTTLRRTFKTTGTDRGKRLNDLPDNKNAKRQKISTQDQPLSNADPGGTDRNAESVTEHLTEDNSIRRHDIQFLDLHTSNPIVAFKGETYSCTWTDLIGTNMFFSQAKETPLYDPEISTRDYDVVGTSRIKLVGNPIKVTPIAQSTAAASGTKKESQNQSLVTSDPPGKSLGTIRRTSAKVNADLRKQATFLEQLINVKKNRGEKDNVHIVMNSRVAKSIANGKLKFATQRREEEINRLNRRVVRGDGEALRKLEQIYSGQDEESDDDASAGEEPVENTVQLMDKPVRTVVEGEQSDSPRPPSDIIVTQDSSHQPNLNSTIVNTGNDNA